jgi:hypothetical protein
MPWTLYPSIPLLANSITDRIKANGAEEITGQVHQNVLLDLLYNVLAWVMTVDPSLLNAFNPWDAGFTYTGGEELVVTHEGKLWLFVSPSNDLATEPGTNSSVWKELSALQLAHFQGTDQYLDQGGPSQVSALDLYNLLQSQGAPSRWHNPVSDIVSAPTGTEPDGTRYLVASGAGAFDGQSNNIAEKKNGAWVFTVCANGDAVRNIARPGSIYLLDSLNWSRFSLGQAAWHDPVVGLVNTPTGFELDGTRYAIDSAPTGPFDGFQGTIAVKVAGAWEFEPCGPGDVAIHAYGGLGAKNRMLFREGTLWEDGTPNIQEVLATGNDLGSDYYFRRRRGDQWDSLESSHTVPGAYTLVVPEYGRMRISVQADIALRLPALVGFTQSDFEVELLNTGMSDFAITYDNGTNTTGWITTGWMPTTLAVGQRIVMQLRAYPDTAIVINSNLEIGTAAQANVDMSDGLVTASNAYVPSVRAARTYISDAIAAALLTRQPLSAVLTTLATASANGQSLVTAADYAAMRTLLGAALANGLATLDATGKIPSGQLPASVLGQVGYQTDWNAATNTPTIPAAAAGNKGWYYLASSAVSSGHGHPNVPAVDFAVGDWLISDGTRWGKVDNNDAVVSVAGRIGAITLAMSDITDASANGRSLVTASNYAAIRALLGVRPGLDVQAYSSALDALASASANGQSLVTAADYVAMRSLLGLVIGTNVQAASAVLSTLAGASANGQSLVTAADYVAMRSLLGLVIGTNVQAASAVLSALAGASANGQSLVTATDYAAMRKLIGANANETTARNADFTFAPAVQTGKVMAITTGSSTITATLGSAASAGDGCTVILRKVDGGSGKVITSPATSELYRINDVMVLQSDGTNWVVLQQPTWHMIAISFQGSSTGQITWASMPSALTMYAGVTYGIRQADLRNFTQARLVHRRGTTAGATGSKIIVRYRTGAASDTPTDYSDFSTELSVPLTGTNANVDSGWIDLPAAAKADVFLALLGSGGNGTASPTFGVIELQFR